MVGPVADRDIDDRASEYDEVIRLPVVYRNRLINEVGRMDG